MRLAERHFPLPDAETCGGEVSLTFSSLVVLNTRKWTRARLDVGLADGLVVVLPVRIELTTSPLPRGCSTTELRQRRPDCENGDWRERADPCHRCENGASA